MVDKISYTLLTIGALIFIGWMFGNTEVDAVRVDWQAVWEGM